MNTITVTITAADAGLAIAADSLKLGAQFDNRAHSLSFVRPEGTEAHALHLVFQSSRHGMMFTPINIGTGNSFVLTNLFTQGERLSLQIMLLDGTAETRSNILVFEIRPSIPASKPPAFEIPEISAPVPMEEIIGLQGALEEADAALDLANTRIDDLADVSRRMLAVLSGFADKEILKVALVNLPYSAFDRTQSVKAGDTVFYGYRAWTAAIDMDEPQTPSAELVSMWWLAEDDYLLDVPLEAFDMIRVAGHTWYSEQAGAVLTQDILEAMQAGPFGAGAHVDGFSLLWGWPVEGTPGAFFVLFGVNHMQAWHDSAFELPETDESEA